MRGILYSKQLELYSYFTLGWKLGLCALHKFGGVLTHVGLLSWVFFSALKKCCNRLSTLYYSFQTPLFLLVFLIIFRADSSRREFLATSCDRQPVVFSEEDPSSPKPVESKYKWTTVTFWSRQAFYFFYQDASTFILGWSLWLFGAVLVLMNKK